MQKRGTRRCPEDVTLLQLHEMLWRKSLCSPPGFKSNRDVLGYKSQLFSKKVLWCGCPLVLALARGFLDTWHLLLLRSLVFPAAA